MHGHIRQLSLLTSHSLVFSFLKEKKRAKRKMERKMYNQLNPKNPLKKIKYFAFY